MAEWRTDPGWRRRARARARTPMGLALAVLMLAAAAAVVAPVRVASAVETSSDEGRPASPQAITEYQPSVPAYAGAPWFEPGQVYSQNFPDPAVVWDGTRYWAHSTSTGGPTLPAMWSTDLVTWRARDAYSPNTYNSDVFFNDAFPVPPEWSAGGATRSPSKAQWAPGVQRIGDSWVAYTSWEVWPGRRCISAASASSPSGPFVDHSPGPLACDADPAGSIDPAPFVDAAGHPWLTWKAEGDVGGLPTRIYSQPLAADGLSFEAGSVPSLLLQPVHSWEGVIVENPSMLYAGGSYWLVYSANDWASGSYRMGQARCDTPAGPCRSTSDHPLIENSATELSPGGGSLFVDAAGRLRLAYQVWNAPYTAYPADPNCDGPGVCTSQGQRLMRIEGLVAAGGALTVDPIGSLDTVAAAPGRIDVAGWALDPSTTDPIQVHLYVDGQFFALTADGSRPDVGGVYRGLGDGHGFSTSLAAGPGEHTLCAYGIGVGSSVNPQLGCRRVFVPNASPFGSVDAAVGGFGAIEVSGWAIDPDDAASLSISVLVDGVATSTRADRSRPDVGAAYPGAGSAHGYAVTVPAAAGSRRVCVVASNLGSGTDSVLDCRQVQVRSASPFGTLDTVSPGVAGISVAGWAIDPDTEGPITVRVAVDGVETAVVASLSRPDVGAAFPASGAGHGFDVFVRTTPGTHTVCAYAVNVGASSPDSRIGCRVESVSGVPFGSLDQVATAGGWMTVAGWVIDPDTAAPIDVHLYVDGQIMPVRADQSRPDVGDAYPAFGSAHGFSAAFSATPGLHRVCAYGINTGVGYNSLTGCGSVIVP